MSEYENVKTGQRYILPTYSGNLNFSIHQIIAALNSGDPFLTWECLQSLYDVLPPDCQNECKEYYNHILTELNKHQNITSISRINLQVYRHQYAKRTLQTYNRPFFRAMISSMFKQGYSEKLGLQPERKPGSNLGVPNYDR